MQAKLQQVVTSVFEEEDIDLSSVALPSSSSSGMMNHVAGLPVPIGNGDGAHGGGRGKRRASGPEPSSSASSCGYPHIDRLLASKKDTVAAASASRAKTLKDLTNAKLKAEKALSLAQRTLNMSHRDLMGPPAPSIPTSDGGSGKPAELEEVECRYAMLHGLTNSANGNSKEDNKSDCDKVFQLAIKDQYFAEKGLELHGLQTLSYMETARADWDLLDSVETATHQWEGVQSGVGAGGSG